MDNILETTDLTIRFGGLTAVNALNMHIRRGKINMLIGPNGSGKTTALNLVSGVYKATAGQSHFIDDDGKKILLSGKEPHTITQIGMARTFQNIYLFQDLNVIENLMSAYCCRMKSTVFDIGLRMPRYHREEKQAREIACEMLDFVGLYDKRDAAPADLPYGHRRLVEIARALMTRPRLLMLDEASAGMNPAEAATLMEIVGKIRDTGISVFAIEHNMRVVMGIADRITVINFGEKIAEGTPKEIISNEEVIDVYLGRKSHVKN
ncbi:MAG: ABC transporter ATP-binding protein [Eubacteriales bacterium]|nr:ABC transporter ATP-binding protein [Eubacteriales bacterium]